MTETATLSPFNAVQNREDFKAFFLQLLEEDDDFCHKIKTIILKKERKAQNKRLEPLPPAIPFSEMPYWKQRPNFKPIDVKPYAIKKETVKELQELWKDAPPIEELIAQLNNNK